MFQPKTLLSLTSAALLFACEGKEPNVLPGEPQPLPVLLLAPEGLTFGHIDRPCSDEERRFCVENRAATALTIEALQVNQDDATPDFTITDIDGGVPPNEIAGKELEAGTRLCFTVVYAPREPGIDSATLEVKLEGFASPLSVEIGGTSDVTDRHTDTFVQGGSNKVDFLIVLDNTTGMAEQNARVRGALESLFDSIERMYDYRIAVTTAAAGTLGGLVPFDDPDAQIVSPSTDDPRATFSSNIRPTESGASEVRSFEAAFRILWQRPFPIGSFLREDAILAIIFVSDRDDASEGPTDLYAAFFGRSSTNPSTRPTFGVSFIRTGFEQISCFAADPPSAVGNRFMELGQFLFSTVDSICNANWDGVLFSLPGMGPTGFFVLTAVPLQNTIEVKIRLRTGEEMPANGWRYEPSARAIIFDFTSPPVGSTIEVSYEVSCG